MLYNIRMSWETYIYKSIFNFRDSVIYFYVSIQYVDGRLQEKNAIRITCSYNFPQFNELIFLLI